MSSAAYRCLLEKFENDQCVVLDGGIGTELQRQGIRDFKLSDREHWGFTVLERAEKAVSAVHKAYVMAGSDVITTNTYAVLDAPARVSGPSSPQIRPSHWIDMARNAVLLARQAIDGAGKGDECCVAFSVGGDVRSEEQLGTINLLIRALEKDPPDLFLLETLSMISENYTREAVRLLLDAGYPVWLSFRRCRHGVCGIYGQLWGGPEGDYFGRLAREFEGAGAGAILINCLPVEMVSGTLPWLRDFTDLPLGAYPNLGRFAESEWRFDESVAPEDYTDMAMFWRAEGAQILGGCCGVTPEHIAALAKALEDSPSAAAPEPSTLARFREPIRESVQLRESELDARPWRDDRGRSLYPLVLPELACDPGVFTPTQGSYLLWKHLFRSRLGENKRCLDVGCGAGILTAQLALNGAEHVMALDIERDAVANTLTNAFRNQVADRVTGKVVDLYAFEPEERYEVVVASLYQMPTDPRGHLSGHRPVDYWGRNLLDHLISSLPRLLTDDGVAYFMQISLLSQAQTDDLLRAVGFSSRVIDFDLYAFSPVFLENLEQIERVEEASDAYHFKFGGEHVMVMYLIEARRHG